MTTAFDFRSAGSCQLPAISRRRWRSWARPADVRLRARAESARIHVREHAVQHQLSHVRRRSARVRHPGRRPYRCSDSFFWGRIAWPVAVRVIRLETMVVSTSTGWRRIGPFIASSCDPRDLRCSCHPRQCVCAHRYPRPVWGARLHLPVQVLPKDARECRRGVWILTFRHR
jgi:hypothetical protein